MHPKRTTCVLGARERRHATVESTKLTVARHFARDFSCNLFGSDATVFPT